MSIEAADKRVDLLDQNRQKAVSKLARYLQTPAEALLREHQTDVIEAIHASLDTGFTGGYVVLPTGTGKTHLFSEISTVLGMKTVVLSPTKDILKQSSNTVKKLSPEADVTEYYHGNKDASGQIVQTTYQSFPRMIEEGIINPDEVGLLICDEVDLSLGEVRHAVLRKLPNALLLGFTATPDFRAVDNYAMRGLVQEDERWLELFNNKIHEMRLQEAIERGLLVPLDVHMLRTSAQVDDIEIKAGEYNRYQLEKFLNIHARNYLTVGMIAGLKKIPKDVKLTAEEKEQIEEIHEQIKGKRTAVFGISIGHIEQLEQMLKKARIKARAVHGNMPIEDRQKVFEDHASGKIQVVLGVDIIKRGWDSPPTEVGIYLSPTISGRVVEQELGRILRPSPETGKKFAIAIQAVDHYSHKRQAPILIPNIFEPNFVAQGVLLGKKDGWIGLGKGGKRYAAVAFSGINIDAVVKDAFNTALFRQNFADLPVGEIAKILEQANSNNETRLYNISPIEIYRELAKTIPRLKPEKQREVLALAKSGDIDQATEARRVLVMISMTTILSSIGKYLGRGDEEDMETFHAAVQNVLENIFKFNENNSILQNVHVYAQDGAVSHIADIMNIPEIWIKRDTYRLVVAKCIELIDENPYRLSNKRLEEEALRISKETGEASQSILIYLKYQFNNLSIDEPKIMGVFREVGSILLTEAIETVIGTLTPREQKVMELRFRGMPDGKEPTFENIGKEFNVTGNRIHQIASKSMRKLRHPSRSRKLKDYLFDVEEEERPIGWFPRTDIGGEVLHYGKKRWEGEVPYESSWDWWLETHGKIEAELSMLQHADIYREFCEATRYIPWVKWVESHPLPADASEDVKQDRFERYLKANEKKSNPSALRF